MIETNFRIRRKRNRIKALEDTIKECKKRECYTWIDVAENEILVLKKQIEDMEKDIYFDKLFGTHSSIGE